MVLYRYNDRLLVKESELITTIAVFCDENGNVTMPLSRLEEFLFDAGYTREF